jgi:hypothetical protein
MDRMSATIREAAIVKIAQLGRAFVEGLNPLGTGTVDLGRETEEEAYTPMQTAGMLGGLVGGGVLLPAGVMGMSNLIQKARAPGAAGTVAPLAKTFWEGAKRPFVDIYQGIKGYGSLKRLANQGIAPTAAQQANLSKMIMKNTTLQQASDMFKKMGPWQKFKTGIGMVGGKAPVLTRSMAQTALPMVRKGLATAGIGLGIPAVLSAVAAYTQYRLGQKYKKQKREEQARAAQQAQLQGVV